MRKAKNKLKLIDTPVYRYWAALYMSFYSRRLYVDVGKRWRGFGLLYLLLAIVIFSIPFSLRMSANFNQSFNQQIIDPLLQLPTLYVQNGELSFDKPMPYLIKNKRDQVVVIIDTTGTVDKFSEVYPYLNILINKDKIYFKLPTPELFALQQPINSGVPLVYNLDKGANLVFDGKQIIEDKTITRLKYVSQLMIYPIVVALLFSILVVILLVLGFLGQVFSRIFFSFQVSFMQASRLLIVSATPMLLALTMILTTNFIFPGSGLILMALLVAYFSLAIFSLKAESKQMVSL